jgi:hypothetical protein
MAFRAVCASFVRAWSSAAATALAAVVAVLPARHWPTFGRLPICAMAGPSAFATTALGVAIYIRGVYAYAHRVADLGAAATLDLAARQASGHAPAEPLLMTGPQMMTVATLVGFALFTPTGLLATYMVLCGVLRGVSVAAGDAIGDPVLTSIDAAVAWLRRRTRTAIERRRRERAEGPESGDRLFTGVGAGLPQADYVVVSSRRKPDWAAGTIVIAGDEWYRVAQPFDTRLARGLRVAYPLMRIDKTEVLRRAVRYEFPPLMRGPGSLPLIARRAR